VLDFIVNFMTWSTRSYLTLSFCLKLCLLSMMDLRKRVSRWIWGDADRKVRLFVSKDEEVQVKGFEGIICESVW